MTERSQSFSSAPMIKWFGELTVADVATVGGKNASLGGMFTCLATAGIRVSNGGHRTRSACVAQASGSSEQWVHDRAGRPGAGPLEVLLMGSAASYLGQYSDCPVVIVPLPDRHRVDASPEEER